MNDAAKSFDILVTSLSVLHNYFDDSTKLHFWSVSSWSFKSFSHFFRVLLTLLPFSDVT